MALASSRRSTTLIYTNTMLIGCDTRYHAWSSLAYEPYLRSLDPDRVHLTGEGQNGEPGETSFTRMVRRWVDDRLRDEWRQAKERGEAV
jgi:hypothetical protein